MRKKLFICMIMVVLTLSACGREDGDEIDNKISELNNTETIEEDTEYEIYNMPESVSYEVTSNATGGRLTKVDATVSAQQTDNISVYSLSYTPMNDDYIRGYANKLFDNAEYEVVKPYEISSMEELNEERNRATDIWEYYGGKEGAGSKLRFGPFTSVSIGPEDHIAMIDSQIGKYQESDVVVYGEGQLLYEEDYYSYEDGDIDGEVISKETKLRGTVDGNEWELSACYINENNKLAYGFIVMTQVYTDTVISQYTGLNDLSTTWYGENKLDIDEAKADAEAFLDKLGFDKVDNIHTFQIVTKVDEKEVNDGYCFIFSPSYDNLPVTYLNNIYGFQNYAKVFGLEQGSIQEYIYVNITSEGIMDISFTKGYDNPVEMTDDAKLLDFEHIDIAAKKYLEEEYPFLTTIDKIELKYVMTYYGDEDYALVPAWIYSAKDDGSDGLYTTCFGVNALDGSIIEFDFVNYGFDIWLY